MIKIIYVLVVVSIAIVNTVILQYAIVMKL